MTLLTEYNEENSIRCWLRDGRQQKAVEDAITLINDFEATPEIAAQKTQAPLELVLEALNKKK